MKRCLFAAALMTATPGIACAAALIFHHKAGVTAEQYLADQEACVALAFPGRMTSPQGPVVAPYNSKLSVGQNAMASGVAAGLASINDAMTNRMMRRDAFDKCMSVKGYGLRKMPSGDHAKLKDLTPEARAARLAELAADPATPFPQVSSR